jgi:acid phosphatase type 7
MMRHSETMRAASRLLLSHPIVCLLAVLAAVVVLGVLGPNKVVHATDVAPVEAENFDNKPTGTSVVTNATFYSPPNYQALRFNNNTAIAWEDVDFTASTSSHDVVLVARASQSGGSPTLRVGVNGTFTAPAQAITNQGAPQPYTFDVNAPSGSVVRISVKASNTGTGRKPFVDYVTFLGDGGTEPLPAQCADGQDNDLDGSVDYPNDLECSSPTDNDETNARLVGAGDIATSGSADTATGDLIDARPDARVFTAGDNAYPDGTASDFTNKYEPAWGPFKNRTSPSPGNHDYHTSGASGYKNYFGSVAGLRSVNPTYYAYPLGAWRVYALDSNLTDQAMTDQVNWLASDMATNDALCEVSYYHHPVASSGQHGPETNMSAAMQVFDDSGGDLALTGHDHNYERFGKVDENGEPSATGFVNIVVGTGGTGLRGQGFLQPGSVVRNFNTHGIVDINLSPTGYSGRFVPVPGKTFTDPFSGTCGTN